jgi:enoyl-CoA hydratase
MSSAILVVEKSEHVANLTLNRPEKLNALNAELVEQLIIRLHELDQDASVRAAIMTGAGDKAFAAGADIQAMSTMSVVEAKAFADMGHRLGALIESTHFPVIAAVNGFALGGGCEIALACDFIYASDKAKLGQPEVNLGVTPGFGGTQRLARRVGVARARELCMTGDMVDAETALRIGLVNAVFAAGDLLAKAKETAGKIASKGPLAIQQCKRVLARGLDVPLPIANELEAQAFSALFGSQDQREGMKAFLEKRKVVFEGK